MNWLIFIAASLSCFRLSRLIAEDKVFDWLRSFVIRKAPDKIKTKAKQGITCPFCVSAYWSFLISCALYSFGGLYEAGWIPIWWTSIWGASILWNQVFVRLSK